MKSYIKGLIKNINNPAVHLLSFIDDKSSISRLAKVNRFAHIVCSSIGHYSYIGVNSRINNSEIGAFCSIASEVYIGLEEHTISYISTSPIFTERCNGTGHSWIKNDVVSPSKHTIIGNDVWIGFRALVKAGVTIGNGAIIGAGAIVTHNIPPYAIVAGIPARIIKYRFSNPVINKLNSTAWWNVDDTVLKNNISMFQQNVEFNIDDISSKLKQFSLRGGNNLDLPDLERRAA